MIVSLEDDFIQALHAKYGDLKKLNLSNNGKNYFISTIVFAWIMSRTRESLTILSGLRCVKKLDKFSASLETLNLSRNELSNLSDISSLSALQEVDLSGNFM